MRRIVSCYFAGPGTGDKWSRMATVLAHTARVHCPTWALSLKKLGPPRREHGGSDNHIANTAKLEHWNAAVQSATDGDELLLIDSDTAILRPLDDVWEWPFDLAYTVRPPEYPHPINGGVVFVRVSHQTRHALALWVTVNRALLASRQLRDRWRKYAGLNQRAFGMLLEDRRAELGTLLALPCREWNCEDSAWATFDPTVTRIVHLKSALRNAIETRGGFGHPNRIAGGTLKPHLNVLARRWMELQTEARAGAV